MQDLYARSPSVVIAFPNVAERPRRPHLDESEPRGEILLFTGVRYERPTPTPGPSRPYASNRPSRRRS